MSGKTQDLSVLEAAVRGAASGLIGGAAVLIAKKLEDEGILAPRDSRGPRWDKRIRAAARGRGISLSHRGVTLTALGGYLAYSALLGAIYGVARSRLPLTAPAESLLESGFIYAASVPISGATPQRKPRRKPSRRSLRRPRLPVDPNDAFGLAAVRAFDRFAVA